MNAPDGEKSLVIWDFDGVLCDSLVECAAVTALAVHMLEHPGTAPDNNEVRRICSEERVAAVYLQLGPLRPYIVRGQDYLWQYFHYSHFKPRIGGSMAEYDFAKAEVYSDAENAKYDDAFYGARKLLAASFGDAYRSLFKPYHGALNALHHSVENYPTFICTNRDQDGVCTLLDEAEISLGREKIFSKDRNGPRVNDGQSKTDQVIALLGQSGGNGRHFLIIEDQVKTPAELAPTCPLMRTIYASYGYGLRNDWRVAHLPSCRQVARADLLLPAIKEMLSL